jgi:DNA-binding PadR family transcriptional regulator
MDPKKIYQKTGKGEEELQTRKYNVPQNLRQVLILVDGKSNITKILEKAVRFPNVDQSLEELARQGFIRFDETVTIAGIKDELIATARQTLGADAEKVIAKIKNAPDSKEGLQATMNSCKKLVKLIIDEKKAEELIRMCSEIMARL